MRFASQVRIAPMSGQVIGLDIPALIGAASAMGYDVPTVMELLPPAEWGMVAGMAKIRGEGEG